MDQLPPLGKSIQDIVLPTFKIYSPLLQINADFIRSCRRATFTYGDHERQKLDVYFAPEPAVINGRRPVLMFEYGGGLVQGSKSLPAFPDDLVHANVGAYFALKHGYSVVIADYRLMSHGAKFPSGGEDLAKAVESIVENESGSGTEPIDLFMMGNSAGGIHLSTFLLHPDFVETRRKVLSGNGTRLRGAVFLSVPFHFDSAHPERAKTLQAYFGDYNANSPLGILKSACKKNMPPDFVKAGARVLVLDAELDPEDEILKPRDAFVEEWLRSADPTMRGALAVDQMPRHNHISPFVSLGTGIEQEEAFGAQVVAYFDNIRKFAPL
ncbi:hypothetical protein LTR78_008490 [Recurvomyces mirabilis]|uniref:BD-FAE-like domain-containing protein n=1 Tax=Recurvomyces mirabilis TaxID=574656 RepID=A0AAE0TT26_9PEZI|nr:hypothetical protein LTR78_008490 [Recurvomyces mirabilis]KAK5156242.1 hypothetical protein LTS14_005129 [Recurvomyces mirabilis]